MWRFTRSEAGLGVILVAAVVAAAVERQAPFSWVVAGAVAIFMIWVVVRQRRRFPVSLGVRHPAIGLALSTVVIAVGVWVHLRPEPAVGRLA
jgi:hypothetical protein